MPRLSLITVAVTVLIATLGATWSVTAQDASPVDATPAMGDPTPVVTPSGLFVSDPTLADQLPAGDPGKLAVVGVAPTRQGDGAMLVLRNNTGQAVSDVVVSSRLTNTEGETVAIGTSSALAPIEVGPGEVALSFIVFEGAEVSDDEIEGAQFTVRIGDAGPTYFPVSVLDFAPVSDGALAGVQNVAPSNAIDSVYLIISCFDEAGGVDSWSADSYSERMGPGVATSLTIDGAYADCNRAMVGAFGV